MNSLKLSPYFNGAQGTVSLPGSKSLTNRAFLLSSLADGRSTLRGILESEDTILMQKALESLGVAFLKNGTTIEVIANGGEFHPSEKNIFLGNSGTSIRFLSALSGLVNGYVCLSGIQRMQERPIGELVAAITQLGVDIEYQEKVGFPPIGVKGLGYIQGGICQIRGDTSSQFISAVLMIASSCTKEVEISIVGEIVSKPYIEMTCSLLKSFGVGVDKRSDHKYVISPQKVQPVDLVIEADASSASHVFSLAVASRGVVTIQNFPKKSLQGDAKFIEILKAFGAEIDENKDSGTRVTMQGDLRPLGEINLEEMPDAGMNAVVLAVLAKGKTRINGLGTFRDKECDRINVLCKNLINMGASLEEGRDYIKIYGDPNTLHGASIDTANDHRIAMCFAVLGSVISGVIIENPDCVDKTFPTFWDVFESLRT